jgi:hypothetical protein
MACFHLSLSHSLGLRHSPGLMELTNDSQAAKQKQKRAQSKLTEFSNFASHSVVSIPAETVLDLSWMSPWISTTLLTVLLNP